MRKKLIITAAVIISLLLLFFGILEYRQYSSYKTPIHRDVATIVKINTDAFIKSLFNEYGFNFRDKIKSAEGKQAKETSNTGIYFPGNIFIYTLKGLQPTTLFCTLPLSDKKDFKAFIEKKLQASFSAADEVTAYDGKLTIVYSKDYAAIAWSEKKEDVKTVLHDLLDKKNLIASDNNFLSLLKKDKSHIVFATDGMNGNVAILKNEIKLHAGITIPSGFLIPEHSLKTKPDSSDYASLVLNMIPATSVTEKTYSVKEYQLDTDSLLQYFKGYTGITVSGIIWQTDTITTYEFDDNFEKTERKTTTAVSVPRMELIAQCKPQLFDYLRKQQFITQDNKFNREIFPLYKVSATQTGGNLVLRTDDRPLKQPEFEKTENFLEATVRFDKLRAVTDSTILKKYIAGIKAINISGKKDANQKAVIEGSILFEAGVLKTLADLLNSF